MRNSNSLFKLVGAASLMVAMVVIVGCAGDQQKSTSLTLGAAVGVETKTDSCCSKKTDTKTGSCCDKSATKTGSCCDKSAKTGTCGGKDCKSCCGDNCKDCCGDKCESCKKGAATGTKPANVKEECATPNSASRSRPTKTHPTQRTLTTC